MTARQFFPFSHLFYELISQKQEFPDILEKILISISNYLIVNNFTDPDVKINIKQPF